MINVKFKEWACELRFAKYQDNDRVALCLIDAEDHSPVATATVNVPDLDLEDDEVIIKDYSENAGMLKALEEAGVVYDTGMRVHSGYVQMPLCKLKIQPEEAA